MSRSVDSLIFDLRARTAQLEKDLKKADGRMRRQVTRTGKASGMAMGKAFAASFGAFLAPAVLLAQAKSVINLGSEITDLATGVNMTAETFQILDFAMREAGGQTVNLAGSLGRMQKSIADAGNGLSTAVRGLDNLGLSFQQLRHLRPEQQFEAIAIAVVESGDQLRAYGAAADILGARNVARLMEVLKRLGADGFEKLSVQARAAGSVMSNEVAQDMDTLADHTANLWRAINIKTGQGISAIMSFFDRGQTVERIIKGLEGAKQKADELGNVTAVNELTEDIKEWQSVLTQLNETGNEDKNPIVTPEQLAAMEAATARLRNLELTADRVKESLKTDEEKLSEFVATLRELKSEGLISEDEEFAAATKAMDEFVEKLPEKTDKVKEAWGNMSSTMSSDLSQAFVDGG